MPFKGASQAVRMRLVQAIIDFLYDNNSKNYNIIRPEETRHFPATIDSPGTPESYTEFAAMLERAHKIHLDQNALPRPTSNTDSQRARYHPSDFWFYKAIIRLNAFHHGTITEEMAKAFQPPNLRANPGAPEAKGFISNLIRCQNSLRTSLINNTMLPLVLFWCNSQQFVDGPFSTTEERVEFWTAKIREDLSVLWWWLQPLTIALNRRWLFQDAEPPTPHLIELKDKLQQYFMRKMAHTADLVYLQLVDHDPQDEDGHGFMKNSRGVTEGLKNMKFLLTVPITEWPTFSSIKNIRIKKS